MTMSPHPHFTVQPDSIEEAVALSRKIPELKDPYGADEYRRRLKSVPHLVLTARVEEGPVGFKVGYEREGVFYSWMGGVVPEWRRRGVAQLLARKQEEWARARGYALIRCKTRNCHRAMLIFALRNDFRIVGVEPQDDIEQHRIWLEKQL